MPSWPAVGVKRHTFQKMITKKRYLQGFLVTVGVLALVRCMFPQVAATNSRVADANPPSCDSNSPSYGSNPSVGDSNPPVSAPKPTEFSGASRFYKADGSLCKNRIYSVPSFKNTFPDNNDVQLEAARRHGVSPVKDRVEAEHRKKELVYVGSNPYFHVDKLNNSIPYLVPRAAVLLQDIGRTFFDSLQMKGIPLHKIIVTSVLRTKDDVQRLRSRNGNATENSCHLYGTTFDICYNRYKTVEDPEGPERRKVRNDTLKWVLSEVLRDFREQKRCHIKYEVKQGCFHMTVD